jgi:uncharacterized protein YjbJ (UPF0337 family)
MWGSAVEERREAMAVNWDVIKGKWTQLKGELRKQWGELTDDEWDQIAGDKEKLIGKLQERYGWSREEAERRAEEQLGRMPL